jgi:hypothetical protein
MSAAPLARTLVYGLQGLHVQDERFNCGGSTNGTSSSGSSRTDTSRESSHRGTSGASTRWGASRSCVRARCWHVRFSFTPNLSWRAHPFFPCPVGVYARAQASQVTFFLPC